MIAIKHAGSNHALSRQVWIEADRGITPVLGCNMGLDRMCVLTEAIRLVTDRLTVVPVPAGQTNTPISRSLMMISKTAAPQKALLDSCRMNNIDACHQLEDSKHCDIVPALTDVAQSQWWTCFRGRHSAKVEPKLCQMPRVACRLWRVLKVEACCLP